MPWARGKPRLLVKRRGRGAWCGAERAHQPPRPHRRPGAPALSRFSLQGPPPVCAMQGKSAGGVGRLWWGTPLPCRCQLLRGLHHRDCRCHRRASRLGPRPRASSADGLQSVPDSGTTGDGGRVRRSAGAASRIYSRSSRKPRSSISSASSSTTTRIFEVSRRPRSRWSRRRPGVPTTMWQPSASARCSRRTSMPPTQDATRAPAGP